ncbi:YihA family ribosome biogenesis GTP-binding protein [Christensenellaceae bacterium NSJ-44]|uniref:Probable GTP-binding protein EngB n=1 Tax=Luoshenia tenuis TaxID=2763654 RepID=A0A926D2G0_9FIRM|nr:ribosome biogenesis GTP-binding protein YihA/YsxC [Luoshenia tenuis]MBC8530053.1 YihA family ribosome biogenesis GTP-binding protein [Luoshenia tenuis]
MLQIKKSSFITSAKGAEGIPKGFPEIAIAGKSNVGKSSFINYMANNYKLARVSGQPGKTRMLNVYRFNDAFQLVDLPGYGYAAVSKGEVKSWAGMVEGYFMYSHNLRHVFLLVDIRHRPGEHDKMIAQFLQQYQIPHTVLATKCDKIPKRDWKKKCMDIAFDLRQDFADDIIPVSAQNKIGRDQVLGRIAAVLAEPVEVFTGEGDAQLEP